MKYRDITNYSIESNLLSDLNYPSPIILRDIQETDGIISFTPEEDPDASNKPYTFCLKASYAATAITENETRQDWEVRTGTVQSNGRERQMIYNLVPDIRNISASDPKYSNGLGAAYTVSSDKRNIIVEPYRVALLENYGVWLVDFNDLDNGGSGAIVLDMNAYGDLSLSNPDSVLGYCYLPKNSAVVVSERIIERFSMVKDLRFDAHSGIEDITATDISLSGNNLIFNMQGMRITNPRKGDIYIINGKKVRY